MNHLVLAALACTGVLATPAPPSRAGPALPKRSNPTIGSTQGWPHPAQNIQQAADGFRDACTLAKAGRAAAIKGNHIFQKYFPDDTDTATNVAKVFDAMIGKDTSSGDQEGDDNPQVANPCADFLRGITVRDDFEDEDGDLSCVQQDVFAQSLDRDNDNGSTIVLCPPSLERGGIKKGYDVGFVPPGPKAVTCDTIGDRTSYKMLTLGTVLVHEYTLGQATFDAMPVDAPKPAPELGEDVYGPFDVQRAASTKGAVQIADSYACFATEAFWAKECSKDFGAATEDDSKDADCDNSTCKEAKPVEPTK